VGGKKLLDFIDSHIHLLQFWILDFGFWIRHRSPAADQVRRVEPLQNQTQGHFEILSRQPCDSTNLA
jgi:hypothetical protein